MKYDYFDGSLERHLERRAHDDAFIEGGKARDLIMKRLRLISLAVKSLIIISPLIFALTR